MSCLWQDGVSGTKVNLETENIAAGEVDGWVELRERDTWMVGWKGGWAKGG